mgnify:CR=1 FL=1
MRIVQLLKCFSLVGALMVQGCASVQTSGNQPDGRYCVRVPSNRVCTQQPVPTADREAHVKRFASDVDAHVIWVIRGAWLDATDRVAVEVGHQQVATLPYTLIRVAVRPGEVTVRLTDGETLFRGGEAVAINGASGEQTFVEVVAHIRPFVVTRFSLRQLSPAEGRRKALASKLIFDGREAGTDLGRP